MSNMVRRLVEEGITMRTTTAKVSTTMWTTVNLPLGNIGIRTLTFSKESKVGLPPFQCRENVEEYLYWEMKVEQIFEYH